MNLDRQEAKAQLDFQVLLDLTDSKEKKESPVSRVHLVHRGRTENMAKWALTDPKEKKESQDLRDPQESGVPSAHQDQKEMLDHPAFLGPKVSQVSKAQKEFPGEMERTEGRETRGLPGSLDYQGAWGCLAPTESRVQKVQRVSRGPPVRQERKVTEVLLVQLALLALQGHKGCPDPRDCLVFEGHLVLPEMWAFPVRRANLGNRDCLDLVDRRGRKADVVGGDLRVTEERWV